MDKLRLIPKLLHRQFGLYFLMSFLLSGCFIDWRTKENNMLSQYNFRLGANINAPNGYCIDQQLIKEKPRSGFLVMVPCNEVVASERPGLITVTLARIDIRSNGSKKSPLEDHLTRQSVKVFHQTQDITFVRPSEKRSLKIYAMQKIPWQALLVDNHYFVVVTLYIPDYILTDQKKVITHLRSVLEGISLLQPEGNFPILENSKQREILRPKARPKK